MRSTVAKEITGYQCYLRYPIANNGFNAINRKTKDGISSYANMYIQLCLTMAPLKTSEKQFHCNKRAYPFLWPDGKLITGTRKTNGPLKKWSCTLLTMNEFMHRHYVWQGMIN